MYVCEKQSTCFGSTYLMDRTLHLVIAKFTFQILVKPDFFSVSFQRAYVSYSIVKIISTFKIILLSHNENPKKLHNVPIFFASRYLKAVLGIR